MPSPRLDEQEFKRRFRSQFQDPGFEALTAELEKIADAAWDGYENSRKAPRTRKAGPQFADPAYDVSLDWIAGREANLDAGRRYRDDTLPLRILIVNGSSRSEHTCPGEMSKSFRLAEMSVQAVEEYGDIEVELLDLSRLTSEYGRRIHPCKACFSTAAPLCHWPCSCYPNYALGRLRTG